MNKALIAENSIFTRRGRSSERGGQGNNESRSRLQHATSGGAPTVRTALTVAESDADFLANNALPINDGDAVEINSSKTEAAAAAASGNDNNKQNNKGIVVFFMFVSMCRATNCHCNHHVNALKATFFPLFVRHTPARNTESNCRNHRC